MPKTTPGLSVILMGSGKWRELVAGMEGRVGQARKILDRLLGSDKAGPRLLQRAELELGLASDDSRQLARIFQERPSAAERVIGHIFASPPISQTATYNEDWALIEITDPRMCPSVKHMFLGDLDTSDRLLLQLQQQDDSSSRPVPPLDGLFRIQGIVPLREVHHPKHEDHRGDPAFAVFKRGRTTGVTVGRCTGVESVVRIGAGKADLEMCVLGMRGSVPSSEKGDSGAAVVDAMGRVAGMLTGGAGKTERLDVTYATPMAWLKPRMEDFVGEEMTLL